MTPVTLTIDLEDSTGLYDPQGRFVQMTDKILALCDETDRKATFFTVDKVAQAAPDLIKRIAARGHEIAYHSHVHRPLTEENPERFRTETREDKDRLEQLSSKPVIGFRAPCYSLTPQSLWATEVLKELGFAYSSSIMPTKISRYGFASAGRKPFRWPCGLVEFPLPVVSILQMPIPYLGGIYLYALPSLVSGLLLRGANKDEVLWTYAHPYDFDAGQSYEKMPDTPAWVSRILWLARQVAERKIRYMLNHSDPSPPLGERVRI